MGTIHQVSTPCCILTFNKYRHLGIRGIHLFAGRYHKPVIAKIADIGSRGTAYCGVCERPLKPQRTIISYSRTVIFYVIGYTVIATAQNIQTVAAGIIT
ncbi:hypothetical protein C8R44DRAFT_820053 [Mycena epipterygia]|nr:hypothetical protein C8R44DRAFT_820053 [Mycena epipterygia]